MAKERTYIQHLAMQVVVVDSAYEGQWQVEGSAL
jgi:hypothetical protein